MKLTKFEIEGTQEEIAQILNTSGENEVLKGSVDDTYKFFREHFLKDKNTDVPTKKFVNENTKSADEDTKTDLTILNLIANIIRREFTTEQTRLIANKLLSYANKKSRIENGA